MPRIFEVSPIFGKFVHPYLNPQFSQLSDILYGCLGARGSAVGRGTALQPGRLRVHFPMVSLQFFVAIILLPHRTMALGSTQPLTEMCTRNISWGVKASGA